MQKIPNSLFWVKHIIEWDCAISEKCHWHCLENQKAGVEPQREPHEVLAGNYILLHTSSDYTFTTIILERIQTKIIVVNVIDDD